ncbi:hypothetical protein F3J44_00100 [Pantoea sp. Tr-811]|uniref:hypothetical protein n=1 Tax=Pantoea sp. Tr-811 TaxID=2608361 RepID=UPI00141E713B|nr:hypothetical protein [Pantoea sp. Tr-811]NIF24773.1 hypothetical protein [Pantoea sp. Tr-811]
MSSLNARNLDAAVDVLVAGESAGCVAEQIAGHVDMQNVVVACDTDYADQGVENLAALIVDSVKTFGNEHVITASTAFGKNLSSRVAALLNVTQVSDVIQIVTKHLY